MEPRKPKLVRWLGYGLEDRGSSPGGGSDGIFFLFDTTSKVAVANPASYPMDTGGKAAGAWSWPLTPSSAEIKNGWSYTS